MSPAAQSAALAKHLGLDPLFVLKKRGLYYRLDAHGYTSDLRDAWKVTEAVAKQHVYPYDEPVTMHPTPWPDWAGDLNALEEAVNTLALDQQDRMWDWLVELTGSINRACFATKAQRLEALLRTLSLWDDSL